MTRFIALGRRLSVYALMMSVAVAPTLAAAQSVMPDSFASSMDSAMSRMDRDMTLPASGDADRDFATMMIPHHQGAIEMAAAELRFGRDPVLRRLAQGIIVEQRQEIAVMHQAIAALPPASVIAASPTHMHKEQ